MTQGLAFYHTPYTFYLFFCVGAAVYPRPSAPSLKSDPFSLECSAAACEDIFCALEVKNTANLRSKSVNSLVAFKEDYPEAEVCLLYRGRERIFHKKVLCLPCEEFLKKLVPGKTVQF
jgi:hypothetical protein